MDNKKLMKSLAIQLKNNKEVEGSRVPLKEDSRKNKLIRDFVFAELDKPFEIDGCVITVMEAACLRLVTMLLDDNTSDEDFLKGFEFVRDVIGEKPIDKVEVKLVTDRK